MPKLIVTSRYLKSGSKKKLANYVKYIATREGSVPTEDKNEQAPATKNQQELILSLIRKLQTTAVTSGLTLYLCGVMMHRQWVMIT